jgi:hypothetical protein
MQLPLFGMFADLTPWKQYTGQKKLRKDIILSGILSYAAVRASVYVLATLYAFATAGLSRFQI